MSKIDKIKVGDITYNIGANAADIEGLETIQYSTIPTASSATVGKIIQYIGTDTTDYKKGHFYICVENNGVYSWTEKRVETDRYIVEGIKTLTGSDTLPGNNTGWTSLFQGIYDSKRSFPIISFSGKNDAFGILIPTIDTFTLLTKPTRFELESIYINAGTSFNNHAGIQTRKLVFSASWTDDVIAITNVLNYSNEAHFLSTGNSKSYTPTGNYHPATKKYVDDAVAGASGKIDGVTTRKNNDSEIEVIGLYTTQDNARKIWEGTLAQYEALATKDNATYYYITDDEETSNLREKVESITSQATSYTIANLQGNKSYKLVELTSLEITTSTASDEESIIYFTSGTTATTVTLPNNITNLGDVPELVAGVGTCEASKNYIISVLNNIAIWKAY